MRGCLLTTWADWCHLVRVGKNYGRDATVRGEQLDGTNDTITSVDWSSTASTASTAIPALPVSDRKHVATLDWSEPVHDEWSLPSNVEHMVQGSVHKEVNVGDERAASKDVTNRPTDPPKSRRDSAIACDTTIDELVTSKLPVCRIGNTYRQRPSDTTNALPVSSDKSKTTGDIIPGTLARTATGNQHWKRLSDTSTIATSSPSDKCKTTISHATINRLATPRHMTIRGEQSRPCSPTKSLASTPNRVHVIAEPESKGTLRGSAPAYNPTASTLRRTKQKDLTIDNNILQQDDKMLHHEVPPSPAQSSPATSLYAAYRSVSSIRRDTLESLCEPMDAIESHALFSASVDPESGPLSTFAPVITLPYTFEVEVEAEAQNVEDPTEDFNEDPNIELAARISTLTRTFVKEYVSIVKGVAGVTYAELHAHMFQALETADGTADGKTILVDEKRLEELRREWYGDAVVDAL